MFYLLLHSEHAPARKYNKQITPLINDGGERMIIQIVKFKSSLSEAEVMHIAEDRAPQFSALPGLRQKYYVVDRQTGEFGGIYLWDSQEALREFRQSELFRSIPIAYKMVGPPRVEIFDVAFSLRPGER